MTLYISKNGERMGPYTITEIHELIAKGTFHAADWAWYEGLTEWVPLQQVPGIVSTSPPKSVPAIGVTTVSTTPGSPARRPVLVWIICLLYFVTIPLGLISLAATPYLLSFATRMQQQVNDNIQAQLERTTDAAQKDRLAATLNQLKSSQAQLAKAMDRGVLYYGMAVVSMIINLVAAILLFALRRSAFPAFIIAFVVGLLAAVYNFATMNLPQGGESAQTVGIVIGIVAAVIGWGIALAILFYVWSLARRNILH
jgi:hypothetical protein